MKRGMQGLVVALFALCALAAGCASGPEKAASAPPAQAVNTASDALPAEQTGGFDGAKAFAHVEKLVAIGPRQSGSPGIRLAQDYIRKQLQSFGCSVEEDSFEASTPLGRIPMKNIVAKIPGTGANVVLLLTHYDTRRQENFVGANDGGSSTRRRERVDRFSGRRRGSGGMERHRQHLRQPADGRAPGPGE
ncbi:MAG: M28 family peptidase [Acidobacteria bacterium]|nr:M28 family peptidase [Acidobacteriota bacterium]